MDKVLVANRGEIAIRVMRALREMGISSVAVYSDVDRTAPHVKYADEAVHIGGSPSSESYLNQEKIIEVALMLNVDGIHPGYGFLSENAQFSQKVEDAGMIFIGPNPSSIKVMGSKLAAKEAVSKYDIPMVPGANGAVTSVEEGKSIASGIGFPVLIKASAGGGGKGMRIVHSEDQFAEQMERAVSEAESAFGDGSVFVEKYISSPRHIEIQILADQHGNCVHLFERECSIQRRHQKVVEEAPSVILDSDLRQKMGTSAVDVAKSCDYVGAGTVEFLVDEDLNYYFLEMNTRLQVEHPVTEMITGIDLVHEQIKIARGEKLSFTQEELSFSGHSIELRVYAEDPRNNFLPSVGKLISYAIPKGPGVRVDDGYEEGMEIPIYYDPMIAKLVTYGKDREEAIYRMLRAISEYRITGIATTLPFGEYVLNHPAFVSGKFDTHFVKEHFNSEELISELENESKVASLLASKLFNSYSGNHHDKKSQSSGNASNWLSRKKYL